MLRLRPASLPRTLHLEPHILALLPADTLKDHSPQKFVVCGFASVDEFSTHQSYKDLYAWEPGPATFFPGHDGILRHLPNRLRAGGRVSVKRSPAQHVGGRLAGEGEVGVAMVVFVFPAA